MNNAIGSFLWTCPYCGMPAQHTPDCQRNSPENRKLREACGQCLPGGYAVEPEQRDEEKS